MKKINKRGELTTQQLVIIIVLIVSFIIILFLLFRLNLGETTNKEICHNSVVLKAKSAGLSGPLDCRTNYLCISGGKDCKGITPTSTVKVNPKNKEEIMKALADEMVDCWWMFGEGEITYADKSLAQKTSCSLCSIVEFDESFKEIDPISYIEFYNYLSTTSKTTPQTYLQYLYPTNNLNELSKELKLANYFDKNLEFDKTYSILTGMERSIVLGLFGSSHVPVVILEKSKENYEAVGCDIFLTKA